MQLNIKTYKLFYINLCIYLSMCKFMDPQLNETFMLSIYLNFISKQFKRYTIGQLEHKLLENWPSMIVVYSKKIEKKTVTNCGSGFLAGKNATFRI